MDPQQRLALETAWEALESALIAPSSLKGSQTGVYMGSSNTDMSTRNPDDPAAMSAYTMTGISLGIIANRISYLLDLHGPSMTIDTACSSSLVAVHQACEALRAGRVNLGDAYAIVKGGEIFLFGASIVPLISASTHVVADDRRTRKLLLHREEIDKLIGAIERKGYTLIPLALYWKNNHVKLDLGVARGKQEHDKRDTEKERDWNREKQRVMRAKNREA